MVPFATRTLLHDKVRLVIAVGGVSFAILLILILRGIMDGTVAKATTYVDNVGADVFVSQEGVDHLALSTSVIPGGIEEQVRGVPGVAEARGIISVPTVIRLDSSEVAVRLVGFDTESGFGGPWRMAGGTTKLDADGIVIDQGLARSHGIGLGDTIDLGGQRFVVQGLSKETIALAGNLLFVPRPRAAELVFGGANTVTHVLVRAAPGVDTATLAADVAAAVADVTVLTKKQLSRNERDLLSGLFVTPVNVMATIGFLVGLMVVGLTVYTAAAERLRDFGVLKAIGAPNRYLYATVIRQALMIGITGYVLGLAGQAIAKPIIERSVPSLGIELDPIFAAQVLGLGLLMSLVSALIPVYRVSALDPKQVFQA